MMQTNRKWLVVGTQSILNILLASWLLNEYVHNKFMQEYVAGVFSTISLVLSVGLIVSIVIVGGSLMVYSRRHQSGSRQPSIGSETDVSVSPAENLTALGTCPFCNLPLKNISENRFQCRKCRRYFKK